MMSDSLQTGTITGTGSTQYITIDVSSYSTVTLSLGSNPGTSGAMAQTVGWEASVDGIVYIPMSACNLILLDGQIPINTAVEGVFTLIVTGFNKFRLAIDSFSGTIPYAMTLSANAAILNQVQATMFVTSTFDFDVRNITGTISLPTGAATSALQTTGNASLASIDAGIPTALGQTTMANSMPVTLASNQSALAVTGTFFQATQPISAVSLPLPTGAATSALQTTGNTSLSSIDTKTPALGQATMANSTPVVIASNQSTINVSAVNFPTTVDTNYGTVGASTLRGAAQIGNATGAADFNAGATGAQTLRVTANAGTNLNTSALALDATIAATNGTVAPGTVATKSQLTGAQFNTTLPTLTNTQQAALQADASGRLIVSNVPLQGIAKTYSAAGLVTSVALATDIFSITGSASKTITVIGMTISGIATAATVSTVNIIKRSTANTVGTPTTITNVPSDSGNAAATATVVSYAGVPTLGTLVGNIRTFKIFLPPPTGGNANTPSMPTLGPQTFSQSMTLRGTGEVLAFNLAGVTITGGVFACSIEWVEY